MKRTETLCLIPAKGKSTRLKRKNIIDFCGSSLLELAIQSAQSCGLCDDIIVSTEDKEIAERALSAGASVPFMRPDELAVDPAGIVDVALYTLERLERDYSRHYETLIILSPTCPLRSVADIHGAFDLYSQHSSGLLMTVCEYDHSPYSAWLLQPERLAEPLFEGCQDKKSQSLRKAYRCNGAVHVLNIARFREEKSYTTAPLLAYEMPRERSVDVDTQEDFDWASFLYQRQSSAALKIP